MNEIEKKKKKKQLIPFCYHHGGDKTRFMTHLRPHTSCVDHFSHAPKIGAGKQSACQSVHQVLQEEIGSFGLFALQSAIFFIAVLFLMVSINIRRVISTFITQGAFSHLVVCRALVVGSERRAAQKSRVDGQRWYDATVSWLSLTDRNLCWHVKGSVLSTQTETLLTLSGAKIKLQTETSPSNTKRRVSWVWPVHECGGWWRFERPSWLVGCLVGWIDDVCSFWSNLIFKSEPACFFFFCKHLWMRSLTLSCLLLWVISNEVMELHKLLLDFKSLRMFYLMTSRCNFSVQLCYEYILVAE